MLKYRPEIDGLRAIAVMAVVIFHAEIIIAGQNIIPGGFIGVDVFFVISGFLITSLLLQKIREESFSFLDFYERRARRLLPILLVVIIFSIFIAWFLLPPNEFADFCYQIITAIFFSSNIYFAWQDTYWSEESALEPLLHTWSLGVEEQFYFFMPVFILVVFKFHRQFLRHWLLICFTLSLICAQWGSINYAQQSFYLLPARGWELLAGGIIATIVSYNTSHNHRLTKCLPTAGLVLIITSFFCFDEHTLHPSLRTLIPVVGTLLVIYFANKDDLSIRFLSTKPIVFIGLISYGLYLWHYPVLTYYKILSDDLVWKLLMIILAIIMSVVTYYLVEKPFRSFNTISSKTFLSSVIATIILLITFAFLGTTDGFKYRFPADLVRPVEDEKIKNHTWFRTTINHKGKIILVGDSHMRVISNTLKDYSLKNGYDFATSCFSSCQLLVDSIRISKKTSKLIDCDQNERMNFILNAEPSIVILGGRLPIILEEVRFDNQEGVAGGYVDDIIQNYQRSLNTHKKRQDFIKAKYLETVQKILAVGHKVILVYPVPEVGWDVPKTLVSRAGVLNLRFKDYLPEHIEITTSYQAFKDRTESAYSLLDQITAEGVYRLYPEKLFCNKQIKGRCISHNRYASYYLDSNHLSNSGAELLVEDLADLLSNMKNN